MSVFYLRNIIPKLFFDGWLASFQFVCCCELWKKLDYVKLCINKNTFQRRFNRTYKHVNRQTDRQTLLKNYLSVLLCGL